MLSKTKEQVSKKICKLRHEGKPPKQAIAIAFSMERQKKGKRDASV